jgi:hypothetical protein
MSSTGVLDLSMLPWGRIAARAGRLGGNFADRVAGGMATPPPTPSPLTFIGGKETYAVSPARSVNAATEGSIYEKLPPINEVVQDVAKQGEYNIQPNLFEHLSSGFRTERGSMYRVGDGGTTTRNAAGDATHEAGLSAPSQKTVYIAERRRG